MKKFLVIGNPIEHSLSPKLHNYWIKKYSIEAVYNKKLLQEKDIDKLINEIRKNKITGLNITVPFKKFIIPFVDQLTPIAKETQSINTIYKKNDKIIGDNTDVGGFELALKKIRYKFEGKKILILGAGGVTSSIIVALKKFNVLKIFISNRTKEKAEQLKKNYNNLDIVEWGRMIDFDILINTTSVGLDHKNKIKLDLKEKLTGKLFYDVIYSPSKTQFLKIGEEKGSQIENGLLMFLYQAQIAFEKWHGVKPIVNNKMIDFLSND